MPDIISEIVIDAPAAVVLDFATTPSNWPRFWPITLGVTGDIAQPAQVGARWVEQVKISFWRGEFHWEATQRQSPTSFEMQGRSYSHGWLGKIMPSEPGQIVYHLAETNGRTTFHRAMHYPDPNLLLKLMDVLFMRRAMTRAITTALQGLKRLVEAEATGPGARPS